MHMNLFNIAKAAIIVTVLGATTYVGLIYAWTDPSDPSPTGNIAAPLNIGPSSQYKMGNFGIGAATPAYKLTVTGQAHISRDGTAACCATSDDFTLSLAENTSVSGKKAGIQFHNSGASEGQLRLDAGNNGREMKAFSYQTDMDIHATGTVQGDLGLCIGTDCRASWGSISGPWTTSGNNIYSSNTGNVGVGASVPAEKLDIAGAIKVGTTTSGCDSTHRGVIKVVSSATGLADLAYICLKTSSDTYNWVLVARGN